MTRKNICHIRLQNMFAFTGCVVVTVAPHLCNVSLWPSPVQFFHSVLEQQQKTRNIKSNP